jgi:hypothetical protein
MCSRTPQMAANTVGKVSMTNFQEGCQLSPAIGYGVTEWHRCLSKRLSANTGFCNRVETHAQAQSIDETAGLFLEVDRN